MAESLIARSQRKAKEKGMQSPPSLASLKKDARQVVQEVSEMNTDVPMNRELTMLQKRLVARGILKSKAKGMSRTLLGNIKSSETAKNYKAFEGMFDQEAVNRAVAKMRSK